MTTVHTLRTASLVRAAGKTGHDRVRTRPWRGGQLIALCDGAGGVAGASGAAESVVEALIALDGEARHPAYWVSALREIDRSARMPASAGLTTAVIVAVADGAVHGASVGDSEAWLVSDTDCTILTEAQNRRPLVGSKRCAPVSFGPVPMTGTLVAGSDGLFKYCNRTRLLTLARSGDFEAIPELLLHATELPSGRLQDDFAVVVCRGACYPGA